MEDELARLRREVEQLRAERERRSVNAPAAHQSSRASRAAELAEMLAEVDWRSGASNWRPLDAEERARVLSQADSAARQVGCRGAMLGDDES